MDSDPHSPELKPWWRRRFFKAVVITSVCIVAFYVIERLVGELAWQGYRKEALARGVKLNLADYERPPIPDDENYAAAPIFKKLMLPGDPAKIGKIFELPPRQRTGSKNKEPGPLDLTDWQQGFLKAQWIPTAGENPAGDVLFALERMSGPLGEIRSASSRPKTQWPFKWSEGPNTPTVFGTLQGMSMCFSLRARALLALDRPDEALGEIRQIARIADSLKGEPFLIFGLVRIAIWNLALAVAEQGIQAGKWRAADLVELERLFGSTNQLAEWKQSLDSERGHGNYYLDRAVTASPTAFGEETYGLFNTGAFPPSKPDPALSAILGIVPRGWIRRAQVGYNRSLDGELEDIDSEGELIAPRFSRAQSAASNPSWLDRLRPSKYILSGASGGVFAFASFRAFELHSRLQQLRVICALTRYRQAERRFPESLSDLVPAYLPAVPRDIMDGQPMRYRRADDGGCRVWSIGTNRSDDGGTLRNRNRTAYDWVSELPPMPVAEQ